MRSLLPLGYFLVAVACASAGLTPRASVAANKPARFALLVGVQKYRNLPEKHQLAGCANDVREFRKLLVERFAFDDANVVVLIDDQATRDAIRRELQKLVERVKALPHDRLPAEVVFHFSGHGSQLPHRVEQSNGGEKRGYDDTILPYDADSLKTGYDLPAEDEHEIRDKELNKFAYAVCADGRARLWGILDCCHSGTGFRGGTTRVRTIHRVLPEESVRGGKVCRSLPEGTVVLAACRDCETAPEYEEGGKSYGLLTRHLIQALLERPDLTYDVLPEAIVARCQRSGVALPFTPQVDGSRESLQATVLDVAGAMPRLFCQVEPTGTDPSSVRLLAGAFHGATVGSRYEIYASPQEICWQPRRDDKIAERQSLGWAEVESVEGASARAKFFKWKDAKQTDQEEIALPSDFKLGYAVERYHQCGDFGMRLRVVRAIDQDTDGPPLGPKDSTVPEVIREGLAKANAPEESKWLHWVEGDTTCDYLLRIDGHYAAIFPATGMTGVASHAPSTKRGDIPSSLRGGWGPFDLNFPEKTSTDLRESLHSIVRARNLLRLATARDASSRSPVQVKVELGLVTVKGYDAKTKHYEEVEGFSPVIPNKERSVAIKEDQMFAVRVTNQEKTGRAVYITVLSIGPNMEIDVLLPTDCMETPDAEQHRLEPGATRMTDPCAGVDTPGAYCTVVLATREPSHFERVTQKGLPIVKGPAGRGAGQSLEEILLEQTKFATRGGLARRPVNVFDDSWSATLLRWEAQPNH